MATSSFNKTFIVTDPAFIEALEQNSPDEALLNPVDRDLDEENEKGIELLKQRLFNSADC